VEGIGYPSVELMAGAGKTLDELELSARFDRARQGGWDASERLRDMDTTGVDVALLYPTIGFHSYGIADVPLLHAVLRGWNGWIADYTRIAPDRLKGVGCVILDDVDWAIEEMIHVRSVLGGRPGPRHAGEHARRLQSRRACPLAASGAHAAHDRRPDTGLHARRDRAS
jgi:predicted TIM-barrel fold metal-dependent hydrolase